jgi:hypothetical protein
VVENKKAHNLIAFQGSGKGGIVFINYISEVKSRNISCLLAFLHSRANWQVFVGF